MSRYHYIVQPIQKVYNDLTDRGIAVDKINGSTLLVYYKEHEDYNDSYSRTDLFYVKQRSYHLEIVLNGKKFANSFIVKDRAVLRNRAMMTYCIKAMLAVQRYDNF